MTQPQNFRDHLAVRIDEHIERAILALRETADDAERILKRTRSQRHRVADVLARIRNGSNTALCEIEGAVTAMADQLECFEVETAKEPT